MAESARRPGRPRIDRSDPSPSSMPTVQVCVRLPASQYDVISTRAAAAGLTIPEQLRRQLQTDPDDE